MRSNSQGTSRAPVSRRARRFRIDKLEERIAPKGNKNGWAHNTKACETNTCFCTSSY